VLVELDGVLESAFEEWRDLKGVCIVRVKWEREKGFRLRKKADHATASENQRTRESGSGFRNSTFAKTNSLFLFNSSLLYFVISKRW